MHAISLGIVAVSWFPALAVPLTAFAVMVAILQVVLGLHYPSDVLAGAVLDAALGVTSLWTAPALLIVLHRALGSGS